MLSPQRKQILFKIKETDRNTERKNEQIILIQSFAVHAWIKPHERKMHFISNKHTHRHIKQQSRMRLLSSFFVSFRFFSDSSLSTMQHQQQQKHMFRLGNDARKNVMMWICIHASISSKFCIFILPQHFKCAVRVSLALQSCVCVCVCVCESLNPKAMWNEENT